MDSANVKEQAGLSRRDFLNLARAGLTSLALKPLPPENQPIQDLFYRIAASALPEQPAMAPGADYYNFPGKKGELLGVHRALTATAKLETFIKTDPTGLQQARNACRKLVVNPAIWTDGLIQPLADQRRISEYLKELQSVPWETGSAQELLRLWFELNRRGKRSSIDAASLEYPRADTLTAAVLRWSGESRGRFPVQLIDFSDENRREIDAFLASFPEEILAKIIADSELEYDGTFDLEYGEPVIRLHSNLLADEIPAGSLEFFMLFLVTAHEFVHALDIFFNKNLWLVLSPSEALHLVTLRAQIANRCPGLFVDPSLFAESKGEAASFLDADYLFNANIPGLPLDPPGFRRLATHYAWGFARQWLNPNFSIDEGRRLLWTPAGAGGDFGKVTDAWVRYQTESFAETAAALISLRQLRGVDLNQWRQEPELQYFRLLGQALARQGIVQVPLGEVFRQLKTNVR